MESSRKKEFSAGIVLYRYKNGKLSFLLLKHKSGNHWSFPKGHSEEGESPEETARRELLEETGLQAGPLAPDFFEQLRYSPKLKVDKTVTYFLAPYLSGELVLQEKEIIKSKWMKLSKALKKLTHLSSKSLLLRAVEYLGAEDSLEDLDQESPVSQL